MKRRLSNQRTGGLTLVEVLVAIAAVVLLAGILLPAFSKARPRSRGINCVSNPKQIGLAFRMFSGEHEERFPWAVSITNGGTLEFSKTADVFRHFLAISNELSSPKVLHCNNDTQRSKASSWDQLTDNTPLSYFGGLDADESRPQSILSGDRNLTTNGRPAVGLVSITKATPVGWTGSMHNHVGNIGLGDGSAQQSSTPGLRAQFECSYTNLGVDSIRLVIP